MAKTAPERAPDSIPDDPAEFFERFLPERFGEDAARHRAPFESPGAALFEVFGVGAWAFRMRAGRLGVEPGKPPDTMLQIGVTPDDFRAIFLERARDDLARAGRISDASRDAFRPIFGGVRHAARIGNVSSTLNIRLDRNGVKRRLSITPGAGEPTEPRATILLGFEDFLALVGGKASAPVLALRGRIGVRGDIAYAIKLSVLLS